MRNITLLMCILLAAFCTNLHAATASWSTSAPSVGSDDVASFDGTVNDRGNVGGGKDDATYISGDRPGQGQTFTTGSDPSGYDLNAITIQNVTYDSPVSMDSGWDEYNGRFEIKIGKVSGSSFLTMQTEETGIAGNDPDSPGDNNVNNGAFMTIVLASPVYLYPDTEYAYTIYPRADEGSPYMEVNGAKTGSYAGGFAFSEEAGSVTSYSTADRVFHVDLTVSSGGPQPTPEFTVHPQTDPAQVVDLSGTWSFDPDNANATNITVPGGGWKKQGFDCAEADYSTTITVPNIGQPQQTWLKFGAVNYQADLYVDDTPVGSTVQAYTPAGFDITDYVTPGSSHDIRLHVKGHDAMLVGGRAIVPDGAGSWSLTLPDGIFRSAELLVYPQVYIEDVFVRTYVSGTDLYYDAWLRNGSSSSQDVTLSGNLTSWNGSGWSYPTLPSNQYSLPADSLTKVTVGPVNWALGTDSYWWPNVPYQAGYQAQLHNLNLTLTGTSTHSTSVRFGFRDCVQQTNGYYLNGIRCNFRGDSLQGANYDNINDGGKGDAYDTYAGFLPGANGWPKAVDNYQRLNYNVVRIHQIPASPYMLDVCDQMGLMIIDETGIRGAGAEQDFVSGWDNMVNHVKQLSIRDRNHASVVRFSQSNEPDWGYNDTPEFEQALYDAAMEVDGTRPISIDAAWYDFDPSSQYGGVDDGSANNFSAYLHYGTSNNMWGQYTDEVFARSDRPYGSGEFIWDADNTKPGFTWFGTSVQAMRAKGSSDSRPYTLLSAWASVIPGTKTTDMVLEPPPWNPDPLYPLYGENNLADPWSNYQIQRVQAGFSPVLVADSAYWELNKTSNANGDWPATPEPINPGASTTRVLNIYNDTFSGGTAVDVFWELRQDSATGTLLDSGVVNGTVPYGYVVQQNISFTAPNAPDGTQLYLILWTEKGGVEMFRETEQYFVVDSTVYYTLTNPGFELPADSDKVIGFNSVPGWTDFGTMSDSGIEVPGISHMGDYSAFLMGGDGGIYNMTGYTIQAGDVFTVGYWAKVDVENSPGATAMTCTLFWDTANNASYEIGWYAAQSLPSTWTYYEFTLQADNVPGCIGGQLGIEFQNTDADWASLDDVTLVVGSAAADTDPPTPDPMTWATVPNATGSSSISMTATSASDPSGVEYYFACTAGGGHDSGWQDSATYVDTGLNPETTYTYTVMARDKSPNQNTTGVSSAKSATTLELGPDTASSDIPSMGVVSGSYVDTQTQDDGYESITEIYSGLVSKLEHIWAFSVSPGNGIFKVDAYYDDAGDTDTGFIFSWSTSASGPWTDMLTVTKTSDNDTYQTYDLGSPSGTIYIRVADNDGTKKESGLDTVYIDHMMLDVGGPADTDPPTPDPMTWAAAPYATGSSSIAMTATAASDPSGVEYNFECTSGGGHDSGWQDSSTYLDTGLSPETTYTYTVTARDKSAAQNTTAASTVESATTDPAGAELDMYVNDIAMSSRAAGVNYFGQATVWIKDEIGANVEGATVYGTWSGGVSGSASGITLADGTVMIESLALKKGGTFTFTVTDVVKSGYVYNSGLNVETSDSITAP